MRKAITVLVSLALVLAVLTPFSTVVAQSAGPDATSGGGAAEQVPGELLVKFKGGARAGVAGKLLEWAGRLSLDRLPYTDFDLVKVDPSRFESARRALLSSGLVEYAEPNYIRRAAFTPDDPAYPQQWNLRERASGGINMPDAWDAVSSSFPANGGSASVVVAVLDTGVAYRNGGGYSRAPDLASTRFTQGYDFINDDAYADDDNWHGTHVCGTAAQSTDNAYGAAGVAFNAKIMPVKVLDRGGAGTDSQIIQGIRFAADRGVEVMNLSLSGPEPNEALREAVDYACGRGVFVCAAAGNESSSSIGSPVGYPAAYPSCVAVGATGRSRTRAPYSNMGSALDLVAPGGDGAYGIIQQTFRVEGRPSSGFSLRSFSGTSMACPHVAGLAALVKSKHPSWSATDVRGAVSMSCVDLGSAGWDEQYGWGLIDAHAAVTQARPSGAGPSVTGVTPAFGTSGEDTAVQVSGTGFSNPMRLILEKTGEEGVGGTGIALSGSTRFRGTLPLADAQGGLWDVVVEDKAMRSDRLQGGFEVDSPDGRTWYLAEGSTNHGFEEWILIQNPGMSATNAEITLMTPGGPVDPYPVRVEPSSRVTVRVNDIVSGTDVSAKVTSERDIICERAMYWGDRIEGTDSIGVQSPSFAWHLAEGTTDYGFQTFLLVQNPSARAAQVNVTYLTPEGPVEKDPFIIDANSRYSINVADDLPAREMSFEVVSDQRVICERSMYWDGMRGGHVSIGTDSPTREWYLAEGSTDWGFDEYVLLGNPGGEDATVEITYMTPSGPVPRGALELPAGSRETITVNEELPGKDVSVKVEADRGVIAERAMYWDNGTGKAGHCSIGVPQPRTENFLAEGSTNWGFDEWILVQNPNDEACQVGVDYNTSGGLIPRAGFHLAGNSRVTIHVNEDVPLTDTSARVYSDLPVIAERAMYWNSKGAGHVSQGLLK
jgi:serine protease